MTDEEKQLLKSGTEAAFKPFANLIERLFGGAVDQIGGMMEDRLRVRRQLRQLELMKIVQAHIEEIGFEPQPIPDKIWLPALQAAMNEDDPTLQEMWADLLANAANPDSDEILPAFPEILRQLSPIDALFFRSFVEMYRGKGQTVTFQRAGRVAITERGWVTFEFLRGLWAKVDAPSNEAQPAANETDHISRDRAAFRRIRVTVDNLMRLGLIEKFRKVVTPMQPGTIPPAEETYYRHSALGAAFITACTRPETTADSETV